MDSRLTLPSPASNYFHSPASSRTLSGDEYNTGCELDFDTIFPISTPLIAPHDQAEHDGTHVSDGDNQPKKKGRKGHSKSRRGCYNCKKARIKCKENRPACDYCSHRGLKCEWPDIQLISHTEQWKKGDELGPAIRNAMQLPQIPLPMFDLQTPVFTMQDFRLFNHFVRSAYPHHPVNNDSVWTHEIPSLASNHDFLLHSMLALSAQDLSYEDGTMHVTCKQLQQTALSYRVKAITALNAAISNPECSIGQGNAMLATCFVLLFQSVFLEDGLIEYMSFIRGIVAVGIHMGTNQLTFLFDNLFDQDKIVLEGLKDSRLIDPELARGACRSLELFASLVKNPREVEYYGYLLSAARNLFTSSMDATANMNKIYGLFCYFMTHEEFSKFVDPNNEAGKLLQAHFVAIQLIMTPISLQERQRTRSPGGGGDGVTVVWLSSQHRKIHPDYRKYYEWTMEVERGILDESIPLKWDDLEYPSTSRRDF